MPELLSPLPLQEWWQKESEPHPHLLLDPDGHTLFSTLSTLHETNQTHVTILAGPEGGLTEEERAATLKKGFNSLNIGPTIFRSHQAIALASGVIRAALT